MQHFGNDVSVFRLHRRRRHFSAFLHLKRPSSIARGQGLIATLQLQFGDRHHFTFVRRWYMLRHWFNTGCHRTAVQMRTDQAQRLLRLRCHYWTDAAAVLCIIAIVFRSRIEATDVHVMMVEGHRMQWLAAFEVQRLIAIVRIVEWVNSVQGALIERVGRMADRAGGPVSLIVILIIRQFVIPKQLVDIMRRCQQRRRRRRRQLVVVQFHHHYGGCGGHRRCRPLRLAQGTLEQAQLVFVAALLHLGVVLMQPVQLDGTEGGGSDIAVAGGASLTAVGGSNLSRRRVQNALNMCTYKKPKRFPTSACRMSITSVGSTHPAPPVVMLSCWRPFT